MSWMILSLSVVSPMIEVISSPSLNLLPCIASFWSSIGSVVLSSNTLISPSRVFSSSLSFESSASSSKSKVALASSQIISSSLDGLPSSSSGNSSPALASKSRSSSLSFIRSVPCILAKVMFTRTLATSSHHSLRLSLKSSSSIERL